MIFYKSKFFFILEINQFISFKISIKFFRQNLYNQPMDVGKRSCYKQHLQSNGITFLTDTLLGLKQAHQIFISQVPNYLALYNILNSDFAIHAQLLIFGSFQHQVFVDCQLKILLNKFIQHLTYELGENYPREGSILSCVFNKFILILMNFKLLSAQREYQFEEIYII
ncbi:hypothetical protein pb186bvf_003117 [Paramecium bursaria]